MRSENRAKVMAYHGRAAKVSHRQIVTLFMGPFGCEKPSTAATVQPILCYFVSTYNIRALHFVSM